MSLAAIATSAFGRRPVTHAQIRTQLAVAEARAATARPGGGGNSAGAVNKWAVFRTLTEIRERIGVSDRALGVLNALLSFHPETALTLGPCDDDGCADLVVHPSNRALCLRANGMSEATLRRHVAALVEAGLIIRRDSPNGKRYARKGEEDAAPAQVFGFDLAPLVARAGEFEDVLETLRRDRREERVLKERITLLRRDLTKRLAFALDEGLSGPWERLRRALLDLCGPLRRAALYDIRDVATRLQALRNDLDQAIEKALAADQTNANAAQSERHMTNSNPENHTDYELTSDEASAQTAVCLANQGADVEAEPHRSLPLAVVLDACRDLADYRAGDGPIVTWRDFMETSALVRPMLGVSLDAWRVAVETLGETNAAVAIAFILQRSEHSSEAERVSVSAGAPPAITVNGSPAIRSPGGYLRALTQKGRAGGLSLWPAVLAHLAQRLKRSKSAGDGFST